MSSVPPLYKVVSPEQWKESQSQEQLILAEMDQEFIHFAMEDQVDYVVSKFWKDKERVILTIDPTKLKGRLVYETNPGGTTKYWHLYEGAIPLTAVLEVNNKD